MFAGLGITFTQENFDKIWQEFMLTGQWQHAGSSTKVSGMQLPAFLLSPIFAS